MAGVVRALFGRAQTGSLKAQLGSAGVGPAAFLEMHQIRGEETNAAFSSVVRSDIDGAGADRNREGRKPVLSIRRGGFHA